MFIEAECSSGRFRGLVQLSKACTSNGDTNRMNIHSSARFTPAGRALLVRRVAQEHWSVAAAAEAAGVSPRTAYKWLARLEAEGPAGLVDRTSRPKRSPTKVPAGWQATVLELRRLRMTGAAIAKRLGIPRSTVARILKRGGLERLKKLDPVVPVRRYERSKPGDAAEKGPRAVSKMSPNRRSIPVDSRGLAST